MAQGSRFSQESRRVFESFAEEFEGSTLDRDPHLASLVRRHDPSSPPRILATNPPGASAATSPFTRSRISATFPFFFAAFIVLEYAVQTSAPVIS